MIFIKYNSIFKIVLFFFIIFFLNGCNSVFFSSHGIIAQEELSLIFISFLMMLLVVLPVIFMTVYFSIKYRSSKKNEIYKPEWAHSTKLEIFIWIIPILIVSFLSYLSWNYSHKLEPTRAIQSRLHPIEIDVVSLDWKWLFIYPEYHIATINEIMFPINRPIVFHITSNSVMNSFFIPYLGSQIYAMPGMITELNLISNNTGYYKGISSNYSGKGFSNMKFTAISVLNNTQFKKWIDKIQNSSKVLQDMKQLLIISKSNENSSVQYFSKVNSNLFHQIINQFYKHN
ncbi:ubiquinol oxidase subunit II [Buchnera aphidicola]|uniref:ubiquinol oxidase subunit II n=1 Tax=Buchnera aphidicola TaxID=9 RepID=UPI003BEEBB49